MKNLYASVKALRIALFLFLFCLIWLVPVAAGQNRSTISGFVFDQQRRPIGQIQVELLNDFNSVLSRSKTDGSGRFFSRDFRKADLP